VAAQLRGHQALDDYVGPVNWDIVAEDWECWRLGVDPQECARRYLAEAQRVGRGILLMHDSSEDPQMQPRNRTMEMTRLLVPLLQNAGFRFARLDELPQVRSAMQVRRQVVLRVGPDLFLSRQPGREELTLGLEEEAEVFGLLEQQGRQVLRASNGLFLSVGPEGTVRASELGPEAEGLAFLSDCDGREGIRFADGRYLQCQDDQVRAVRAAHSEPRT
jgi:hypothetical protein